MDTQLYKRLAEHLDALPQGFPPTEDGAELRLLQKIFTPEQAELAAQLRVTLETPAELAERLGRDKRELRNMLKEMARNGLIRIGKAESGLGFGALPFVVGIYEFQLGRIDAEMALLFEDYYQAAFGSALSMHPQAHRVLPVNQTIRNDMEVRPHESAAEIVRQARAWGVQDCICRIQKELIDDPCEHPKDVCMVLSNQPGAFDHSDQVQAQTLEEALATLQRAADAGLVHSVSNSKDVWYVCNCCTCSCGILRGMAELGMANVVARSAFVNQVDEALCVGCGTCLDYCQFAALTLIDVCDVNSMRCVGCGVCVPACPEDALTLVRRPEEEILPVPETEADWMQWRADKRGLDLGKVM